MGKAYWSIVLSGTYQCFYELADMEKGDFGDSGSWKILQIGKIWIEEQIISAEKHFNDENHFGTYK